MGKFKYAIKHILQQADMSTLYDHLEIQVKQFL